MTKFAVPLALIIAGCSTPGTFTASREPIVYRTHKQANDLVACVLGKTDRFHPRPTLEPLENGARLSAFTSSAGVSSTAWLLDAIDDQAKLYIKGRDRELEAIVAGCA